MWQRVALFLAHLVLCSAFFSPPATCPPRQAALAASTQSKAGIPPYRDEQESIQQLQQSEGQPTFTYSDSATRRRVSEERGRSYTGPPLGILLLGKPSTGKGTLAPMISRAYHGVIVGTGNLLRMEVMAGTERGALIEERINNGEMLPVELVLGLVKKRMEGRDCKKNGYLLDGVPRSGEQAMKLREMDVVPDCIIFLDRPDEVIKEFCLGRMEDSATGVIYHPRYAPAPPEVKERLVWRVDDQPDVIDRRLEQFREEEQRLREAYPEVPVATINSARNEIETFQEICDFVDSVAAKKIETLGTAWLEARKLSLILITLSLIPFLYPSSPHVPLEAREMPLLAAVRRCNSYDMRNYLPVVAAGQHVGYMAKSMAEELKPYVGTAVEFEDEANRFGGEADQVVNLVPYAITMSERSLVLAALVSQMVTTGVIPAKTLRDELQDVRPFNQLCMSTAPVIQMERAAMIYFGIPGHATHVNGWVRADDGTPEKMWVGLRSASKATYPGRLDQMVAGGQPAGLSYRENVEKECLEEACVPVDLVGSLKPVGQVSYRYATRKGLSTKVLSIYDLELPPDFVPYNADGEVDEFMLMTMDEVLTSISTDLPRWKPNSALCVVDFAVRHGHITPDSKGYLELCHLLRAGYSPRRL
ncbi:unnamed protein product [Chrysoparadoxa australica]